MGRSGESPILAMLFEFSIRHLFGEVMVTSVWSVRQRSGLDISLGISGTGG